MRGPKTPGPVAGADALRYPFASSLRCSDSTAEKWDATKRGFELAWQDFQREWEKTGN